MIFFPTDYPSCTTVRAGYTGNPLHLSATNLKSDILILGPICSHFPKWQCPFSPVDAVKSFNLLTLGAPHTFCLDPDD